MGSRERLAYVDGLRAIAVLALLAFDALLPQFQTTPRLSCLARGIELFFVISGFCLAYPYLSQFRDGSGSALSRAAYGTFALRRFSRVAPPFYVALALFAILGATPFGFPTAGVAVTAARATHEFFLDLAFLIPNAPVHNTTFWTLGVAVRWYLVCPLLIALYVRSRWAFAALMVALYGTYVFVAHQIADLGTLPCFMAGILAADAVVLRHAWTRFAWLGAAAMLAVGIATSGPTIDHGNPIWHAAAFFLVVAASTPIFGRIVSWRPLVGTGVASYSIYLYHAPFAAWFELHGVVAPLAAAWALCLGFVAWALIESKLSSDPFRRRLEALIASIFRRARPPHPKPTHAEAA